MKREAMIPFDGFYQSFTDEFIDHYLQDMADATGMEIDWISLDIDYHAIAARYVEEYQAWIKREHNLSIPLEFVTLQSPREYNFQTDRIFCNVHLASLQKLRSLWTDEQLQERISERFKSRDGFISFYDYFVNGWKDTPLEEWDHNELSVLFPEPDYYEIWESPTCNGFWDGVVNFEWEDCGDE